MDLGTGWHGWHCQASSASCMRATTAPAARSSSVSLPRAAATPAARSSSSSTSQPRTAAVPSAPWHAAHLIAHHIPHAVAREHKESVLLRERDLHNVRLSSDDLQGTPRRGRQDAKMPCLKGKVTNGTRPAFERVHFEGWPLCVQVHGPACALLDFARATGQGGTAPLQPGSQHLDSQRNSRWRWWGGWNGCLTRPLRTPSAPGPWRAAQGWPCT